MRKLIVIAIALSLGGCAGLSTNLQIAKEAIGISQKSVVNPVTKTDLANIEIVANAGIKGLLAYKRACAQGIADANCRSNVAKIQVYTRQIPPYIAQLRSFVKNNDQVNAGVVYDQLKTLFSTVNSTAAQLGVNMGNTK